MLSDYSCDELHLGIFFTFYFSYNYFASVAPVLCAIFFNTYTKNNYFLPLFHSNNGEY